MFLFRFAALLAGVICTTLVAPRAAIAQDVELRSLDGSVTLEGDLVAFDGAYYRLTTAYGPLTIAAEGVSCAGPGCPDLASFIAEARVAGASTVAETLLPSLLSGFAESRGMIVSGPTQTGPDLIYTLTRQGGGTAARFIVTPGTSDTGILALLNGDTDLALSLRPASEAERRADRAIAPDDPALIRRVRVIGLDALVPIVAQRNTVRALSLPQLAQILTGEIDNWRDFGGPDAPIALHLLDAGLGLAQSFEGRMVPSGDVGAPHVTRHSHATDLAMAVARDAYALGVTAQSARGTARALTLAGTCGFSQAADATSIKAEDYPLTAPVYVYLAPHRLPQLVRDFLSWTETEAAETIVERAGFINQSLTRTPLNQQGTRLANALAAAGNDVTLQDLQRLVATLGDAERLSTTFRFDDGSVDLDAQSRAAITRLAAAIERGAFDGRRLMFIGFSDSAGPPAINLRLSLRRAEAVRDAVLAAAEAAGPDRITFVTDAFGEGMPMACEDTDWGRAVNRRVEVWVQ